MEKSPLTGISLKDRRMAFMLRNPINTSWTLQQSFAITTSTCFLCSWFLPWLTVRSITVHSPFWLFLENWSQDIDKCTCFSVLYFARKIFFFLLYIYHCFCLFLLVFVWDAGNEARINYYKSRTWLEFARKLNTWHQGSISFSKILCIIILFPNYELF